MLLNDVATTSADVGATSSRLAKTARLAQLLSSAGPGLVGLVVSWLSGELPQRQIGVGWAALRSLPAPAHGPSLTVEGVDDIFSAIGATSGAGSKKRRAELLDALFGAATEVEQVFLRRLLGGELRQGALVGVMYEAVAKAADVPAAGVRRAAMLGGALPSVAEAVMTEGPAALDGFRLQVGRPIGPMLAQTATDVTDALTRLGDRAVFETKLDGARVQVHREGASVRIFTRTLDDVTARLPEIVEATLALPVTSFVGDGEAIAFRPDGRPHRFQVTASRFGRSVASRPGAGGAAHAAQATHAAQALSIVYFDILHLDGVDLLDAPGEQRAAALARVVPPTNRVGRVVTDDPAEAQVFLDRTLAAGHEGVLAKSLDAPYEAGRRGAGWLKIKPVHTFDLVVLAVEWGSGRRSGKLSNIHLGARDPDHVVSGPGGVSGQSDFVMLGKTFKGMTDELLAWQTEHFLSIADGPTDGAVVRVRPEQVVEIAFDGVQTSTRYPGGMALRFARVLRYRNDKTPAEADTLDTVRSFHARADE